MIENQQIEQLVREAIQSSVDTKVLEILEDPAWVQSVEHKIINYVRHRISHSLTDITSSPDIVTVIKDSVTTLMSSGLIPGIDQYVDQDRVRAAVYSGTQDIVRAAIDQLILDPKWLASIERAIIDSLARRIGDRLSGIDVTSLVMANIDQAVQTVMDRRHFRGVLDQARAPEILITDQEVNIPHDLTAGQFRARDATVDQTLTVNNLAVRGSINTDNRAWTALTQAVVERANDLVNQHWQEAISDQVLKRVQEHGIDFGSVRIDGHDLVRDGVLAAGVTRSSLEKVGVLESLQVRGPANIGGMAVRERRIGINTDTPEMALSVWDEEVSVIAGKLRQNTAYLGTSRAQALTIGVNRTAAIDITDQGRVTINHLTVGRHRICHEPECPNYSGTKGDIVFNSNPKNDGIWGWQCLGAFRWVPLRTT